MRFRRITILTTDADGTGLDRQIVDDAESGPGHKFESQFGCGHQLRYVLGGFAAVFVPTHGATQHRIPDQVKDTEQCEWLYQ